MKSPLLEEDVLSAAMPRKKPLWTKILSGSLTLLAGSGLVGVMNLVYNLAIARLLGPSGFGHATAVYTLLMLMSAVTLSFQIVCAKLVARPRIPSGEGGGLRRVAPASVDVRDRDRHAADLRPKCGDGVSESP